ncbi:Na+/H+ antiporter NhaA [Geobacter sp. AOG2]|uniref:Na+/H+ antiporter NhaA n=1 Tax=Geobacter sp. AOG2 TaxID=1566347 RepID=UPI0035A7420E
MILMKQRINLLLEFSVPMLTGVVVALTWVNLDPSGYHAFLKQPLVLGGSFHFITNELFMVLFFGIAAVEITKSCLPGGALNPPSRAVNPLLGTLGGVLGPVVVYLGLNAVIGGPKLHTGWGIPTATDIALAWLAARAVFGAAHPAVSYLLLLAVADDAVGLAIIAIFYPDPNLPVEPIWLLLTVLGMLVAYGLRRLKVKSYWPAVICGGALSWSGLHHAHLHPALALVFIVPFLPHGRRETKGLFEEDLADHTPLSQFEHEWKVLVDMGMFMFGLANAGVEFSSMGTVTWLVLAALLCGKPLGIFTFSWVASRFGFALPRGMHRTDLLTAGIIAGTGFTVALFVAGEAFADPTLQGAAKMGAMLSIASAGIGLAAARLLGIRRHK